MIFSATPKTLGPGSYRVLETRSQRKCRTSKPLAGLSVWLYLLKHEDRAPMKDPTMRFLWLLLKISLCVIMFCFFYEVIYSIKFFREWTTTFRINNGYTFSINEYFDVDRIVEISIGVFGVLATLIVIFFSAIFSDDSTWLRWFDNFEIVRMTPNSLTFKEYMKTYHTLVGDGFLSKGNAIINTVLTPTIFHKTNIKAFDEGKNTLSVLNARAEVLINPSYVTGNKILKSNPRYTYVKEQFEDHNILKQLTVNKDNFTEELKVKLSIIFRSCHEKYDIWKTSSQESTEEKIGKLDTLLSSIGESTDLVYLNINITNLANEYESLDSFNVTLPRLWTDLIYDWTEK
jgi:hypothetical protein